jgi:deazaflavin-dependent oxidoreductase (nitroreductase family)
MSEKITEPTGSSRMADVKSFNESLIEEFRATNGKVTGVFADRPLVLLTHTGAKSGRSYVTPLVYSRDGDRLVVIASKGGAPEHPQWYTNMVANPTVTVELPGETFSAAVTVATGDERTRLYNAQAETMPVFHEYAAKAGSREIPVLVLTPNR